MLTRLLAAALLAALILCAPAVAAPTTVQLRVEGAASTIFEGPVTTDGKLIDKGDGPHPCDGTTAIPPPPPGATMTSALDDASLAAGFGWQGTWFPFGDFLVSRIGPDEPVFPLFWTTVLNYVPTMVGGCQQRVAPGDDVLFALGDGSEAFLRLSGPATARPREPVGVSVREGAAGTPATGATVSGGSAAAISGADGSASVSFDSPGLKRLKAARAGAIRSNAVLVCVSPTGANDCGVPTAELGGGAAARPPARDSRAPVARISGPRDGRRYRRGPRVLRGTAADAESGVTAVKLALRRHVKGKGCRWWSGRRERFVGRDCRKTFFFAIGDDAQWSYLLPRRLGPGRYVLDVKAFDRSRNRDERFVRGANRVVFEVSGRRNERSASASASARPVEVMVVGRERTLVDAGQLRPSGVLVRASGRRCKVAASTPLAALVHALGKTGVRYRVRDYGHCSRRSSGDSGQLFVTRVGGDRNHGQEGWVYKVDGRAGSASAGDSAGPFGAGRLRGGERVLWFYCRLDARSRSCQRTLDASVSVRSATPGKPIDVRVRARDNEGHSGPAAGATVVVARAGEKAPIASAACDSSGRASISLPAAGRYALRARDGDAVASFPLRLEVK